MCGIIGYAGRKQAARMLYNGLLVLTYRGYDSCSMTTACQGSLDVRKDVGAVPKVSRMMGFLKMRGTTGVAHTRWASTGVVSKVNAHPQVDCTNSIAVVHNGTISNYQQLKNRLALSHQFVSETDTEVIPHLIEEEVRSGVDLHMAVYHVLSRLEGEYAVVVMDKTGLLVASRSGLPLILGITKDGAFVASDLQAVARYTKTVVYLEDKDIAILSTDGYSIFNGKRKVSRTPYAISLDQGNVGKQGFDYYMLKEITEQTKTLRRLRTHVKAIQTLSSAITGKKVFLVGSGTSYNACLAASYSFRRLRKQHVFPVVAADLKNYEYLFDNDTVILAVSQSGETADLLYAVNRAKAYGAKICSIVNSPGSALARLSDVSISMDAGPEVAVASTKAYTAELGILELLIHALSGNLRYGQKQLEYLENVTYYLLSPHMQERLKKVALKIHQSDDMFVIGRDEQYATALEAALKLKEVARVHAEAILGSEMKHGPLALIEKGTPVICLISHNNEKESANDLRQLKTRGAYIIGVHRAKLPEFDVWIKVRDTEYGNPILQIIPIQLLAYYLARAKKIDPDMPRNLAKSVTVR